MQTTRNILEIVLPIVEITLAVICWMAMIYYVFIRLKEIENENKTN
jgi:hypothetical protein